MLGRVTNLSGLVGRVISYCCVLLLLVISRKLSLLSKVTCNVSSSNNKSVSRNNNESIRTPVSCSLYVPVRRTHDLMKEGCISPKKKPKIRKCQTLEEILFNGAATISATYAKHIIIFMKLGRLRLREAEHTEVYMHILKL